MDLHTSGNVCLNVANMMKSTEMYLRSVFKGFISLKMKVKTERVSLQQQLYPMRDYCTIFC